MVHACTIVARNYLPAARVLAGSFFDHHPDGSFTTLVVDDVFGLVAPSEEPFDVMHLEHLGLDMSEARRMAAIYDVTEFSTALKPWLLRALLDRGCDPVLYLDPDIKVFAPLDGLAAQAERNGIVLTPHVTQPIPRDGKRASESDILGSGIYNLGFIGVGRRAADFLDFWMERLAREAIVAPDRMRFTDQRWVDFVPGIYDVAIERSPVYNVAYWNLDHRKLSAEDGRYLIDGQPLAFFHFSGYSPNAPHLLSKHQGPEPRILLSEHSEVRQLCDEYGAALLAEGYGAGTVEEYGYKRLPNGVVFDAVMRLLYREALLDAERGGLTLPPNPLDPGSAEQFVDWLNERSDTGAMSRYLAATYMSRPDLRGAFPDPEGEDRSRFNGWIAHEVGEGRLEPRLAVAIPEPLLFDRLGEPRDSSISEMVPGVRVAGYLRAETGVGEHGRLAVATVEAAGIPVATFVDTTSVSRQAHGYAASEREDLNVNLICVNADQIEMFARRVGAPFFAGRYTIGLWAWELEEFPAALAPAFDHVDEVWANSEFSRSAIAEVAALKSKPVFAFPLPIAAPSVSPGFRRDAYGIPDGFFFLFCFDLMSVLERKNPLGLIEAFSRAFSPGEGPTLVIKVVNAERKIADLELLRRAAAARTDIVLIDTYLQKGENAALMDACDCYVSLHRSEGFGLTMAEAMALGKPVIATGYSGNLDFMTPDTSYLVRYEPGEVPLGAEPYRRGARWAEPDLDHAAELLRHVFDNPELARAVGERARHHVAERHAIATRAGFVAQRFEAAQRVLADPELARATVGPGGRRGGEVAGEPALIALARRTADLGTPSRFPRLARRVRRLVERLIRHHDTYQREMNMQLALGVEHIARLVSELQAADRARDQRESVPERVEEVDRLRQILQVQGDRIRRLDEQIASPPAQPHSSGEQEWPTTRRQP